MLRCYIAAAELQLQTDPSRLLMHYKIEKSQAWGTPKKIKKMNPKDIKIQDYTYDLPEERIAKFPLEERDGSKLLVYKNGLLKDEDFKSIAAQIEPGTIMVFNNSKVVNARLIFKKESGGVVEIFCLAPAESYTDIAFAMQQKNKVYWQCLVGGAKKWKDNTAVYLLADGIKLQAEIAGKNDDGFIILFSWDTDISFAEVLQKTGNLPLPPYMNRIVEASDLQRYQTTYAAHEGSVAAPTAGLHFTEATFNSLTARNISTATVTLHVGAGTFKPVKAEIMQDHNMHYELFDVELSFIKKLLAHNGDVICVGTTSLRTVESLYWIGVKLLKEKGSEGIRNERTKEVRLSLSQWECYELTKNISVKDALTALVTHLEDAGEHKVVARTQIIIAPGYTLKIAKGIVTNFHQPQSTLLLLIAAITGKNWRVIYNHALQNNYRFLSYGDSSLIYKDDR